MENPSVLISTADSTPILTEEQRAHWEKYGYLSFEQITSPSDLQNIRTLIQGLFETKAGFKEGAQFNLVGKEGDPDAPAIAQIIGPRHFASSLRRTPFFRNATELAKQILGDEAGFLGDHTLCKPAKIGPATPWHQDEAFRNPEFDYNEISIWMPLQAVNEVNGCMEFMPGSNHSDILPHRSFANDDTNHGLECFEGFDPDLSRVCPLPAGGCTVHSGRTLHAAGPNLSDAPRYAYVLIFGYPPVAAKKRREFPWLEGRKTGRGQRMRQWMRRGGLFVAIWRFFREASIKDVKLVFGKLRMQCTTFLALWRKRN
jgi:ectoine hydroxylase-related dioxygenase (phytanoyl-CoA dioxygenase family)